MYKVFLHFFQIFGTFDHFLHGEGALKHWKIIKCAKILAKKLKKSFVQLTLNPFFNWFQIPENQILGRYLIHHLLGNKIVPSFSLKLCTTLPANTELIFFLLFLFCWSNFDHFAAKLLVSTWQKQNFGTLGLWAKSYASQLCVKVNC